MAHNLRISLLLAAFNGYLSIALALVRAIRVIKKGTKVCISYVEPRLPGDCEEERDLEASWKAMRLSKMYVYEGEWG